MKVDQTERGNMKEMTWFIIYKRKIFKESKLKKNINHLYIGILKVVTRKKYGKIKKNIKWNPMEDIVIVMTLK